MDNKWLKQFLANYNGESDEAKSLEAEIQKNYKGNAYIGWATMERLIYQQDPEATFEVLDGVNGTPLLTMTNNVMSEQRSPDKTIYTSVDSVINFVKVKLTFLGKTFEEIYPVQAKDYSAPKFVDSNDVNKAVQRAKAKISSRASGLALKLYEGNDLQFDPPEKPTPTKAPINLSNVTVAEVEAVVKDIITNFDKYKAGIDELNKSIKAKYNWEILKTTSEKDLVKQFSDFADPRLVLHQIKKKAGIV